jgi:hypothetical protein
MEKITFIHQKGTLFYIQQLKELSKQWQHKKAEQKELMQQLI